MYKFTHKSRNILLPKKEKRWEKIRKKNQKELKEKRRRKSPAPFATALWSIVILTSRLSVVTKISNETKKNKNMVTILLFNFS